MINKKKKKKTRTIRLYNLSVNNLRSTRTVILTESESTTYLRIKLYQ